MNRPTLILFVWKFSWWSNTFVRVVYIYIYIYIYILTITKTRLIYICNELIEETARRRKLILACGSLLAMALVCSELRRKR